MDAWVQQVAAALPGVSGIATRIQLNMVGGPRYPLLHNDFQRFTDEMGSGAAVPAAAENPMPVRRTADHEVVGGLGVAAVAGDRRGQ
jgi:hypothetical protein